MEKRFIHLNVMIVADEQAAKVSEPGEGPFHFVAFAVATKFAAIVERRFLSSVSVRTDQDDASFEQAPAQWIAVVGFVGHYSQRSISRPARAAARHVNALQGWLGQGHFPRTGRLQFASQRNTLAVDHHHPLRAFAALGFSDAGAPFLAGAKLPSKNDSLQSRRPFWSSSERNCRQILSQVPSSSQRRKRRQHVLGLGYLSGKSFQRAPVLRIQRMPSRTNLLSAHGRPLLERFGSSGSMCDHCLSERNTSRIRSFSHIPQQIAPKKNQNLSGTYETASKIFWIAFTNSSGALCFDINPAAPALRTRTAN